MEGMTVGKLIAQRPASNFWTNILRDLPDDTLSEFACGNYLIAEKKETE